MYAQILKTRLNDVELNDILTLEKAKEYLTIDYDEEDALIQDFIARSVDFFENFTGTFLFKSLVHLEIVGKHLRYLPYSPIDNNTIEVIDGKADVINFSQIEVYHGETATVEYEVGGLPIEENESVVSALLEIVQIMYEKRGQENFNASELFKPSLANFRVNSVI